MLDYREVRVSGSHAKARTATSASLLNATAPGSSTADSTVTEWLVRPTPESPVIHVKSVETKSASLTSVSTYDYVANQVIVTLMAGEDLDAFSKSLADSGFVVKRQIYQDSDGNRILLVAAADPDLNTVESLMTGIQDTGVQAEAGYDIIFEADAVPNDMEWPQLWGMEKIGAPQAWATRTDASPITVAVLDTGVNYNHVDLYANMWVNPGEVAGNNRDDDGNGISDDVHGMRCVGGVITGNPMDDVKHGSHCAGTIGAVGNNSQGVVGVAWQVKIMALKFLDSNGLGSLSDALTCLQYAAEHDVKLVSCSFGTTQFSSPFVRMVKDMSKRGIIFVCAAGNKGWDNDSFPNYPSSIACSNVVAVAATDSSDRLASFSCYGVESVDIAAPGVGIYSTTCASSISYEALDGTSMATPHVTGALALLMAHYPDETPYQIVERLYAAGEECQSLVGKVRTGKRLSLSNAFGLPRPDAATVSQGLFPDRVSVYWNAVEGASHYRVSRAESENGEKVVLSDWFSGLTFSDTNALPGVTYWYFIQTASSADGASASTYSVGVSGYRQAIDTTRITVTFDPQGGTVANATRQYMKGEPYAVLPTPGYAGMAFLGWHTAANGGVMVDETSLVREDVTTLYAHWIEASRMRVNNLLARQRYPWNGYVDVTFDLAGVPTGEYASVALTASEEDGTNPLPLRTYVGAGPTNLTNGAQHVVWNATPDTQAVLYRSLVLNAEVSIDVPGAPLSGTATDNPAEGGIDLAWTAAHGATLYEIWRGTTADPAAAVLLAAPMATAHRDTTGVPGTFYHFWIKSVSSGGISEDALHLSERRGQIPTDLTISGDGSMSAGGTASFVCTATLSDGSRPIVTPTWSIVGGSDYAESIDANGTLRAKETAASGNVTIEAQYTLNNVTVTITKTITVNPISVTITFNANAGTVSPASQSYIAYGPYGALPIATRTGHAFDGWWTETSNGNTPVTSSSTVPAANTTLIAHWTPITYTIRFNANDGTGTMADLPMTYDTAKTLANNVFANSGYTFAGWATSPGGSVAYANGASVNNLSSTQGAVVDLYAVWERVNGPILTIDERGTLTAVDLNGYTDVVIPSMVKSIGENVFFHYTSLSSVTIPNGVTNIGECAFFGCNGLTSIAVPASVANVGRNAFSACDGLASISVAAANANYASREGVLYDKDIATLVACPGAIESVVIPGTVTNIGNSAFYWSASLENVTIPESVTSIGPYAFGYCYRLSSVAIPGSVKDIRSFAFFACITLANLTIGDGVERIWNNAFDACRKLENVTIPRSVRMLGSGMFQECDSLTSVTILGALDSYSDDVFFYLLTPQSLTTYVTALWGGPTDTWNDSPVEFLTHAITFDANGGMGTMASQQVVVHATSNLTANAFTRSGYMFAGWATSANGPVVYANGASVTPSADMTLYAKWTASGGPIWTGNANGVLTAVDLNGYTDVAIPEGVKSMSSYVFRGMPVTSVSFPASLESVGVYAFYECRSLTNVTFSAGTALTKIDRWAFCCCTSLTGVFEIPEGVTEVAFGAFMGSGVNTIVFPATLQKLGAQQTVFGTPLTAVYFKGNAPTLEEDGSVNYPEETSPYCNAPASLVTYVRAGSIGWQDSSSTLPASWPTYAARPIQSYSGTPPHGTSGVVASVGIEAALDNPTLSFTTGGDANWETVTSEAYSGGSSVKSGVISDSQSTWLQTEVSGAGTLSFWYKVSSEANFDKLIFYIDGVQKMAVDGLGSDWLQVEYSITDNTQHVLKWVYTKDISVSSGDDCCWIDAVTWRKNSGSQYMVIDLSGGSNAVNFPISYMDEIPSGGWTDEYKTTKLVLRHIDAGTFIMGSPADEVGREPYFAKETQHEVTLTKSFYAGVFEVTQKQLYLVMGTNTSYNKTGDAHPCECVGYGRIRGINNGASWPTSRQVDEDSFMGILRRKTGFNGFDLPTEAQWEYACRAGTTTALNSGKNLMNAIEDENMDEVGRYNYSSGGGWGHAAVGQYACNAWGLYDMHGNVSEHCLDWLSAEMSSEPVVDPLGPANGERHVYRGGNWGDSDASECRSACRSGRWGYGTGYDGDNNLVGFRLFYNPSAE